MPAETVETILICIEREVKDFFKKGNVIVPEGKYSNNSMLEESKIALLLGLEKTN